MFRRIHNINRYFHTFSGEDVNIIRDLNHPKINRNFNIIGFSVALICIGCFLSSGIFIFNVLDGANKVLSIPIGVFWGFIVTNIYILLLYTISPPLLFHKSMMTKEQKVNVKKNERRYFVFKENIHRFFGCLSFSMVLRLLFIFIFSMIIAQPLNVIFFGHKIENDVQLYKMRYKSNMILTNDKVKITEEVKLFEDFHTDVELKNFTKEDSIILANHTSRIDSKATSDAVFLQEATNLNGLLKNLSNKFDVNSEKQKEDLIRDFNNLTENQTESDREYLEQTEKTDFGNPIIQKMFDEYANNIKKLIEEKHQFNQYTSQLIDENKFYIRQIILLHQKVPFVLVSNIIFLFIFLFPIYLKFQIRKIRIGGKEGFYTFKKEREERIVKDAYNAFVKRFRKALSEKYSEMCERAKTCLNEDLERLRKINPILASEIDKDIEKRFSYRIEFFENYTDPPFNLTEKKKDTRCAF